MDVADALVLGLDSFVAGAAVAPLLSAASQRLAAAAMFGAADAAASLLGAGLLVVVPGLPALYGAYLLAVSLIAGRGLQKGLPALLVLSGLAVALSLDNLLAGGTTLPASAVAMGCASAALMLLGVAAGGRIFAAWSHPRRTAWVATGLVLTASCSVVA